MSFAGYSRGRELEIIVDFLNIFGVVEERQVRELFRFLDERKYGQIISAMNRKSLLAVSPDSRYMARSIYALNRKDKSSSVGCFWALIALKDEIADYSPGDDPAVITILGNKRNIDLIPVTGKNAEAINDSLFYLNDSDIRFLVASDLNHLKDLNRRKESDYVFHVGDEGVINTYTF